MYVTVSPESSLARSSKSHSHVCKDTFAPSDWLMNSINSPSHLSSKSNKTFGKGCITTSNESSCVQSLLSPTISFIV